MKKKLKEKKNSYVVPELFIIELCLEVSCLIGSQETGIGGEGSSSDMDGFE